MSWALGTADGREIESPAASPVNRDHLRDLFISDLHKAGMSGRKIAMVFAIGRRQVASALKSHPDTEPGSDYLLRLTQAIDTNPQDIGQLCRALGIKVETLFGKDGDS